jgi:isoleucyl-tRNA synthetase
VKDVEYITDTSGILSKKRIKPDFKVLGPKYGKKMKEIATAISDVPGRYPYIRK